jgi:predicted DNA-binding antitoxin AbrB/MazE fold protein
METTITAIYEAGVLRPLTPISLPEHTTVELVVRPVPSGDAAAHRAAVIAALRANGLSVLTDDQAPPPLSEEERAALARRLPPNFNLSQAIREERDER